MSTSYNKLQPVENNKNASLAKGLAIGPVNLGDIF